MSPVPANRPQYSTGAPVPEFVDSSTAEFSRNMNPTTGAKGPVSGEPTEVAPTVTGRSPASVPAAAGQSIVITGDNLGGSTGVTVGGVACTDVVVESETRMTAKTGAGSAGAGKAIVVLNPAGNSSGGPTFTLS